MREFVLALCLFLSAQLAVVSRFWFVEGFQLVNANSQLTGASALVTTGIMAAVALAYSYSCWRLGKRAWGMLNSQPLKS